MDEKENVKKVVIKQAEGGYLVNIYGKLSVFKELPDVVVYVTDYFNKGEIKKEAT